ncbi:MAG TPA: hypothetical protein VK914_01155 [bacterium]|nr:hypothetical protein [bacterium]
MPPNPTTRGFRPSVPEETRQVRLWMTVRVASWWLIAQGAMDLLLGGDSAGRLNLRYDDYAEPYLRLLALTLLCLGFFMLKALRDPRRQYLAVDVLTLYMMGHVYFLLSFRLGYHALTPFEWFSGVMDLGLATSLVLHRTRSSQMQGAGSLLSDKALDLAKQTGQWVQKKGPAPRPTLGGLEPGPSADAAAAKSAPQKPPSEKSPKGSSEAIPHLD